MNISIDKAELYARLAGFKETAVRTIVAIAMAESGLDPAWEHFNADGSLDRGILQINNYWHSEVSDADAYNAAMAFVQGYRISNEGSNFTPWTTYTNGAYLQYTSRVPEGWTDDGVKLTNPINGFIVEKGFRQYILNNVWASWDVPLADALLIAPGGRQVTRAHILEWNSTNNQIYQRDQLGNLIP